MGDVMSNVVVAAGLGTLSMVVALLGKLGRHAPRGNPALVGFLTFVIAFGGLMAWDASR